jgi:hypothetical protein
MVQHGGAFISAANILLMDCPDTPDIRAGVQIVGCGDGSVRSVKSTSACATPAVLAPGRPVWQTGPPSGGYIATTSTGSHQVKANTNGLANRPSLRPGQTAPRTMPGHQSFARNGEAGTFATCSAEGSVALWAWYVADLSWCEFLAVSRINDTGMIRYGGLANYCGRMFKVTDFKIPPNKRYLGEHAGRI